MQQLWWDMKLRCALEQRLIPPQLMNGAFILLLAVGRFALRRQAPGCCVYLLNRRIWLLGSQVVWRQVQWPICTMGHGQSGCTLAGHAMQGLRQHGWQRQALSGQQISWRVAMAFSMLTHRQVM